MSGGGQCVVIVGFKIKTIILHDDVCNNYLALASVAGTAPYKKEVKERKRELVHLKRRECRFFLAKIIT